MEIEVRSAECDLTSLSAKTSAWCFNGMVLKSSRWPRGNLDGEIRDQAGPGVLRLAPGLMGQHGRCNRLFAVTRDLDSMIGGPVPRANQHCPPCKSAPFARGVEFGGFRQPNWESQCSRPTVRVIGSGSKQECFHCRQGGGGWRRMLAPHRSRAIKAPCALSAHFQVCPLPMGPYPRVSQYACAAGIFCLVRQRQLAYTPRDLLSVFVECARTMVAPRRINCCDEGQVPGGPTVRQYE